MPRMPRTSSIALFVVAGLAAGCGGKPPTPRALSSAATAVAAPALAFPLLAGGTWTSKEASGRVLVIDVWATYCKPCRASFPQLDRLAAAHPEVTVIALSVDPEDPPVRAFLREVPTRVTIARDPTLSVLAPPLGLTQLPSLVIIDQAGRIRMRTQVAERDYAELPGLVQQLLDEGAVRPPTSPP